MGSLFLFKKQKHTSNKHDHPQPRPLLRLFNPQTDLRTLINDLQFQTRGSERQAYHHVYDDCVSEAGTEDFDAEEVRGERRREMMGF